MKRKHTPLGIASLPVVLGFGVSESVADARSARAAEPERARAQEKRVVELRDFFP